MATTESWEARDAILSSYRNLKAHISNFKTDFAYLMEIKTTILDDATKKADLKLIFDQDSTISLPQVVTEYNRLKTIYDWLVANA